MLGRCLNWVVGGRVGRTVGEVEERAGWMALVWAVRGAEAMRVAGEEVGEIRERAGWMALGSVYA